MTIQLQTLDKEIIKNITQSIRVAYDLIAITLTNGEILIGGLAKHWKWNGQVVSIAFNTETGNQYGNSYVIDISIERISGFVTIPLSDASIPYMPYEGSPAAWLEKLGIDIEALGFDKKIPGQLPVQDYPNPLATIICKHNLIIARKENLSISGYMERALSTDSIPTDGIEFNDDFVIYADWEYFSRQSRGSITFGANIPGLTIEKDTTPSLESLAHTALKISKLYKLHTWFTSTISQENVIIGKIFCPEKVVTTNIEGEECIVIHCKTDKSYPVLIKPSRLKYPIEFLNFIQSDLRFYGEVLAIPITINEITHFYTLLARAIGYIK